MYKMQTRIICLFVLMTAMSASPEHIWIEGENAINHTMKKHGWYDSVNKSGLSGGQWLSHFANGNAPEAAYTFNSKTAGEYHFWVRANSVANPKLSYQLDEQPWTEINLKQAIENLNIASDSKPDMRFISWINVGKIKLSAGTHNIKFKFHSKNNNHGGLDCFVFTTKPFMPRGALKPGAKTGRANPGYFAWEPEVDKFTDDALIDLRSLNEDIAGQGGYLKSRGNKFVLPTGQKIKFWAVNAGPGIWNLDDQSHVYLAKHLAKRGVNMVRLHGGIYRQTNPDIDHARLKKLHHLVWALKQEGIYSKISFYFPAWFRPTPWHTQGDRWPFNLLFFDQEMQTIYFKWAHQLLTTPNPYTNLPLGKDPAVAILEIQNEDSYFFHTFNEKTLPPEKWSHLKKLYARWLEQKHGSLDKAIKAWNTRPLNGDDIQSKSMELLSAWHMSSAGLKTSPANRARISDQVQFLTENMRDFYRKAINNFRSDCGYKGLVSCGNWHTADAKTLDALERYCYTVGDVTDRHGYFDHNHKGDGANYSIRAGHSFTSQSALHLKHNNPIPFVETDGMPNIITEIGWPMPNMYRAESTFLTAAYGSLLGTDGIYHFSVGSASWDQNAGKFILNSPTALGSYFAAALVYRNQYVQEAKPVVTESLPIKDLFNLNGTNAYVRPALDQFRKVQTPNASNNVKNNQDIDPMSFYVGRVVRNYKNSSGLSKLRNLDSFIDRDAKTITSHTKELRWDFGQGAVTMNTPKAQGAVGFLKQLGPINCTDITIDMKNDYGSVMVVAMDNKPLRYSKKILIQCITIDQPFGWETSQPGGLSGVIKNTGTAPLGMEKYQVTVTFKNFANSSASVIACDENGYATDKISKTTKSSNKLTININPQTPYTIIKR